MTIRLVKERLAAFLLGEPKILMLTGGWGAGKTYQWKQAFQRSGQRAQYSYISLFGLKSLAEVKRRVAEESAAAINIPGKGVTIGETIEEDGWRLKPRQIIKLLPIIPYLGKLEGLANELSFFSIRNTVVCFDDLERAGDGLGLADVFGLALFLKEERQCKVILISNQDKFDSEDQRVLQVYLEKVIDETVNLTPTSAEACEIALGLTPDAARTQLRERIIELEISNIRVITRLYNMAAELVTILGSFHERVLRESIHSLAIFGAAKYLSSEGFPSFDYLLTLDDVWGRYSRSIMNTEQMTEVERRHAQWDALLQRYGNFTSSALCSVIASGVQQGFFDRNALVALAQECSISFEADALQAEYRDAWTRFWQSLDGDGDQLLDELQEITRRTITAIGIDDLWNAYEVFSLAKRKEVATELLELFIAKNQDRPAIFNVVDGPFSEKFAGPFKERLQAVKDELTKPPSIEEVLDHIAFGGGWTPEDLRIISKANAEKIESIIRQSEGRKLRERILTLLRICTFPNAKQEEVQVSHCTREVLRNMSDKDPITAIRLRQYLPAEKA